MVFVGIGLNLALEFETIFMRGISISFLWFVVLLLGVGSTNVLAQTAIINSPNPIPTSICHGDSIDFTADDNSGTLISYQWNFNGAAAGPQTLFGQNVRFYAGNIGSYTMQLVVNNGTALDTLNFNLNVNGCGTPTIDISASLTTICSGTQTVFNDATVPGSTQLTGRLWTFPGGAPATSNVANPVVTYTTAGVYDVYFEISDASGTYRDTLKNYITAVNCPDPIADFTANVTRVCPGSCINFTDQSQNMVAGQSSWAWSFPGSDSTVSVQQNPSNICYQIPGLYTVILTATNATGTDTKIKANYIRVDSCLPPIAGYKMESEKICQNTCVKFINTSRREDSLDWHFFGVDPRYEFSTEENPVVCYDTEGEFYAELVVNSPYGADFYGDSISVMAFPKVQAPADTSVLVGQSVRLQAFGSGNGYRWSPNDGSIDCPFCSRVNVSPSENTKYFVTNINENGCERTDSVNVVVVKNYHRGVPDAFSPNGDDVNDLLLVYGNGILKLEFYVYDRTGTQVFESRSTTKGWDGTFKGEPMEAGVYAYFAVITYESGFQEILKGDVTLVR